MAIYINKTSLTKHGTAQGSGTMEGDIALPTRLFAMSLLRELSEVSPRQPDDAA